LNLHIQIGRHDMKTMLGIVLLIANVTSPAWAREFLVHPGPQNNVIFISTAAMEKFEGKTHQVEGKIVVEPGVLGDSATVHFEVDLASLDTGLARRDQHMRDSHLETAKFPRAVFDGASVIHEAGASLSAGRPLTFECDGTFSLHGVSRRIQVRVDAVFHPAGEAGSIQFVARFPVTLADYQISRPEFLFLKLAETQQVRVEGVATAAP
jgi:polyisoprenoid-binding protein YceI